MKNRLTKTLTACRHSLIASPVRVVACLMIIVSLFISGRCFAGIGDGDEEDLAEDEIPVFVTVQGVGSVEIPAYIRNEAAYLSITDFFDFLKIKNTLSHGIDSITGYLITPQANFIIDKKNNHIIYQQKVYDLKQGDLVRTGITLYLRLDYFGRVFGLNCKFNFRSLSVTMTTSLELPVIKEIRQAVMRSNLNRLKGEEKVDTTIGRRYPAFHFGMADWSAISTQDAGGQSETRLSLAMGSTVAGGEMNALFNYSNKVPFTEKQQFYQWHFVNNDHNGLRQVMAGKIFAQSTSSIYAPVAGIQFTNTPTTYRRSFGTYRLSNYTEPGWTVELYVNSVLVNYTVADASGFYTFDVPLVYGNSVIKLRFYGPYGEERFSEQNINIPFNFLPSRKLEYTVTGGMVEDSLNSRFFRANFNYGVGSRLTVGGGLEYLSSVTSDKKMPFINASFRVTSGLLIAGEYTYGVRSRLIVNYRLPSNLQVELDYIRYKKGQTAINNTFLEERKAIISFPFRSDKFSAFSRFTAYQVVLPPSGQLPVKYASSKYTTLEYLVSGVLLGLNTNFTTYALFTQPEAPYYYSNLSMVFRMPAKIIFTPQVQYEYNRNKLIGIKGELGKYLSANGYVNVFYENNYKSNYKSIGIGLRYDFSFAQTGFSAKRTNHANTFVQSASGSFVRDGKTNYIGVSKYTSVGKGGITVLPFLDINCNGKYDKGEPRVEGVMLQINGGRLRYSKADTLFRVSDLEAYATYTIKANSNFDNVAWQINKRTINVVVDPNQYKLVEIPVRVVGEVSGMIYIKDSTSKKGQGRIIVSFYRNDSTLVGQTLSEADGFFNFTALTPGSYTAKIDAGQMKILHMSAAPAYIPFTISGSRDGDVIDNLEFILQLLPGNEDAGLPLEH